MRTVLDKVPMGTAFAKGLALKMDQTHRHKYLRPLLAHIEQGEVDPAFVIHASPVAGGGTT